MKYVLFIFVFALACQKAEDRSCWKFTGKASEKRVDLVSFKKLKLGPYLDFVLVQDTAHFVVIKGGENVVNLVKMEISTDGELKITNTNRCRFLRNPKKGITVEIHFVNLEDLFFEGSGLLTNEGKLISPNLTVTLNEGSGTVNLNVECVKLNVAAEPSWANYVISGVTTEARLSIKGNAYGDTRALKIDSLLTVISRSSAHLEVNADGTGVFKCETWGNGNVYYWGTPAWIDWNDYGTGKLLKSN